MMSITQTEINSDLENFGVHSFFEEKRDEYHGIAQFKLPKLPAHDVFPPHPFEVQVSKNLNLEDTLGTFKK